MKIKKLDYEGSAKKLEGEGLLKYCLWINENAELYIQLIENDKAGRVSHTIAFPASKYVGQKTINNLEGININNEKTQKSSNNNDVGFLKAILLDILPENGGKI